MFIANVPEDEAPAELADYYAGERAAWGFVPDYAACFAAKPAVARAWAQLGGAVRSGMDRRRYEIASIGAARARRSTYCTTAHAMFLRDICGDDDAVRAIAALHDLDGDGDGDGGGDRDSIDGPRRLDPVDAAVLHLAGKVASDAASVEQADIDALRELGLSDADIADVVYTAAARAFFTAVLDGLGARLDAQTAAAFEPEVLAGLVVGHPPLSEPSRP